MSVKFQATLDSIKHNQSLKKQGKDISIPFGFARLDKVHPGITKGTYTLISAKMKEGKSQFTNYLYIINLIDFLTNSNTNIKAKVFYFTLEMTTKSIISQLMCHRLWVNHKIRIDTKRLNSLFKGEFVNDDVISKIEADHAWFEKLEETVEFIENVKNPYGIFKTLVEFYDDPKIGEVKYKEMNITHEGIKKSEKVKDCYVHKDSDLFVFCIIDNYNLLSPEKGGTVYEAIHKFSSEYAVTLRNFYQTNVVAIQQQSLENDNQDAYKMSKFEPSVSALADCKSTSKDIDIFITIYSPMRNKLSTYEGYNITHLKDHYRRMSIQFDRNGIAADTDLYFDGCTNTFKQLPECTNKEDLTKIYNLIKKFE